MNRLLALILLFSHSTLSLNAQNAMSKRNQIEALNSVLNFANESDHGLLIVHRMLENYNQDVNKYVDLESFKINFYTNKDLPKDIFDDPENWFYDNSPYEWHGIASTQLKGNNVSGATAMISDMTKMKNILTEINQLRFDLDAAIINKDLTDTVQLNKVYSELERGVRLYDGFYDLHQGLLSKVSKAFKPLKPTAADIQHPKLYKAMVDLYLSSRSILQAVRTKEDEQMDKQIAKQRTAINTMKALDFASFGSTRLTTRKVQRIRKNMEEQADLSLASAKKFYETAYYKVIYPKKLEKVDHLTATDSKITRLPTKLKDREISMSTRTIKVDSLKFQVSLYDHMIEDGDVISLNFNGDWIVEKMPLLAKKKKLKLQLNEEGKNYFILHANNVGRRPPNTMAVDYYYRGFKKQIILKSDLNVSELIEIEYVPSK